MLKIVPIALLVPLLLGAAPAPAPIVPQEGAQMGALCFLAIMVVIQEQGHRCHAGEDPEFQAEVADNVDRVATYVMSHSNMTPAGLEAFKDQQGGRDQPTAQLCEAADFYGPARDRRA